MDKDKIILNKFARCFWNIFISYEIHASGNHLRSMHIIRKMGISEGLLFEIVQL